MPPKRRASPKGRPNRGKFKCTRCERLVNGDERNNHINKIHDGDQSVQFNIFCGDESKQPKLSFVKSVSKVPPSDDSTADGNGNLVLAPAAATVHEESVPPAPVFRVHDEAAPTPTPMDLQSPSSAGNLHRVTAAADADHILNEIIKLSSRGHNNDVMLVCSDGCMDSNRIVLGQRYLLF